MSQPCPLVQVSSESLRQLQLENVELQRYLNAQRTVIASLERRVGRSLESLGVHLKSLAGSLHDSSLWQTHLSVVENEVSSLCDLVEDTLTLQRLEAGTVEVHIEPINLHHLMVSIVRAMRRSGSSSSQALLFESSPSLPPVLADEGLIEAVLADLLSRGLKHSDADVPVILETDFDDDTVEIRIMAQRFAPAGNREFATEIVLCCRRVEVQQGQISCQEGPGSVQTILIVLQRACCSGIK